jgi:hypothetical protein
MKFEPLPVVRDPLIRGAFSSCCNPGSFAGHLGVPLLAAAFLVCRNKGASEIARSKG